jgi:hypothetical protein
MSKLAFPVREMESFVADHRWVLLRPRGGILRPDALGMNQQAFVASVTAQFAEMQSGFFSTEVVLKRFREESGCVDRLFNHVSIYRILLCYCGLAVIMICRPNQKEVSSFVCGGESCDLFDLLLQVMNMAAEEKNVRLRKAMDFLEMCAVDALKSGAPVGSVLKRQKELAMAVCATTEMVLDGLHDGTARFEFRRRVMQFWNGFDLVNGADATDLWAPTATAVATLVFFPSRSPLSGRPTVLSRFPGFLNALESVIEECGGRAHARLQEMAYSAGSNASSVVYQELLLPMNLSHEILFRTRTLDAPL